LFTGAGQTGNGLYASEAGTYAAIYTNSSEKVRIDSSGRVGIGMTANSGCLLNVNNHIRAENSAFLAGRENASLPAFSFHDDTDTGMFNVASNILAFSTAGSEAMRIDSSGNLLVGLTSITDATSRSYGNAFSGSASYANWTSWGSGSHTHAVFRNGTSAVGSITTTASATAYNTSSDYRLKDVDGPITNSGAYIDALKPVQGSWKVDGSRFIGLIAHEVQEVSETPIATGEKDGEEMQGMDYSAPELIANLIAEIQSLRARVAQLEGA